MNITKNGRKGPSRPKVTFNTPGHECQHADRGACPKCHDPMHPKNNVTFALGRKAVKRGVMVQ